MISNEEMRQRINEMVDMLGQTVTLPASDQAAVMGEFRDVLKAAGLGDTAKAIDKILNLDPADLTTALLQLQRELLKIRDSQFQ